MQFNSTHLPSDLPWELLDRYLTNNVSAEERYEVDAYLCNHPEVAASVQAFAGGITSHGITDLGPLGDHVWDKIHTVAIDANPLGSKGKPQVFADKSLASVGNEPGPAPIRSSSRLWMTMITGSAALCMMIIGAYNYFHIQSPQTDPYSAVSRTNLRRLSTGKGQRASIELTDGTKVTLNVASTLTVHAGFGERDRVIHLEGEAFFQVPESAGKPFIVNTANSSTRVLGTQFSVREYREDQRAVTTVFQGKVDVAGTVLTAHQQGVRMPDGRIAVSSIDNSSFGDWMTGQIVFDHTPLQDVITELNRWYDTEFVLDDTALAAELVTLRAHNRSASEVATILTDILGIRFRKNGTRIVFIR